MKLFSKQYPSQFMLNKLMAFTIIELTKLKLSQIKAKQNELKHFYLD